MDPRVAAHAIVQGSALSPCKNFAVFGFNFAYIFVLPLNELQECSDPIYEISSYIKVPECHAVYCLHTKEANLWIGSRCSVLVIPWANFSFVEGSRIRRPLSYSLVAFGEATVIFSFLMG